MLTAMIFLIDVNKVKEEEILVLFPKALYGQRPAPGSKDPPPASWKKAAGIDDCDRSQHWAHFWDSKH